jgi:hypothetical protein
MEELNRLKVIAGSIRDKIDILTTILECTTEASLVTKSIEMQNYVDELHCHIFEMEIEFARNLSSPEN